MLNRPKRILIVEDNKYEVQAIKDHMNDMPDFKLVGVSDNAGEAMQLVTDQKPDIVIVDFTLQGSIGSKLIKSIRSAELAMQPFIISCSATIEDYTRLELLKMGANICLVKGELSENPSMIFDCIADLFEPYLKRTNQESKMKIEVESTSDKQGRLEKRIVSDLETMGINSLIQAHEYSLYIMKACVAKKIRRPVFWDYYAELAKKTGVKEGTIERAINHGITKAFSDNYFDSTQKIYTVEYGSNRDKPSTAEFLCFFINKYIDEGYSD